MTGPDQRPWWDVTYTLDDVEEHWRTRAETAEQAAWFAALDLAERGFGSRVELIKILRYTPPSPPF